ncbi:MAG: hypothetical protein IJJ23_02765 [Clostridia bacterium]|nr:hypothetical protein [Clostridia bacterium]
MNWKSIAEALKSFGRSVLAVVVNNWAWKILSIIIAIMLWSFIVSSDSSITQLKTLANVEAVTSGLTVLQSRDLALLTDVSQFDDIHVRVEASQANYSRVTNDTVHVEVDLSQVTSAGVQEIELTGVTTYGKVVQITPSSVEVVIESLSSRYVPVNVELAGERSSDYWYNISRVNPTQVTVTGPSSIVRTISSARASVDITEMKASQNRSVQLSLLDEQGSEIGNMLARPSITEAMINIEVYPCQQVPVDKSIATSTSGQLPDGFRLVDIDVQPDVVTIAADQSLLDELDILSFAPIDVTDRTGSFAAIAAINTLKDIKYISSEQVTVTVYIEETNTTVNLPQIPLRVHGASSGQTVTTSAEEISARATGLYTQATALTADDIQAYVDVTGLTTGEYELDVTVIADGHPDLTLESDPATVKVSIADSKP